MAKRRAVQRPSTQRGAKAPRVLILNGPNLNLLGLREPEIYGSVTFGELADHCTHWAGALGLVADFRQSNHEGVLIDWMHEARNTHGAIVLNAGAYTHTSIALLDAIKAVQIPVIEVHLSNPFAREPFRHQSYVSPAALGLICGFGIQSYRLALEAVAIRLNTAGVHE